MSKNRDFLEIRQLRHALCALCVLTYKVKFGRKRLSRPFFFLGGRKYGWVSKTAFQVGSVRKLGYSGLEYSESETLNPKIGAVFGRICERFANCALALSSGKRYIGWCGVDWVFDTLGTLC